MQKKFTAGAFLRKTRMNRGETQIAVTKRFAVSKGRQQYANKLEVGAIRVSLKNIEEIVLAYDLTPDERKELEGIVFSDENREEEEGMKKEEFEIFYRFLQLPKEVRERINKAVTAYESIRD